MLSEKNVRFYMNDNVTEIRGVNGKVEEKLRFCIFFKWNFEFWWNFSRFVSLFSSKVKEVVLKSAKVIPADVLIVGIGEWNAEI